MSTLSLSPFGWRQQFGQTLCEQGSDTVAMVLAASVRLLRSTDKCHTATLSILMINYYNLHIPVVYKLSALCKSSCPWSLLLRNTISKIQADTVKIWPNFSPKLGALIESNSRICLNIYDALLISWTMNDLALGTLVGFLTFCFSRSMTGFPSWLLSKDHW